MYSVKSSGLIMLTIELYKYSAIQMKERREWKTEIILFISVLLLFSHSVMSDFLQSHGLQASLSFTLSPNLLRFTSIESTMLSNHLILCCFLLLCLQSFLALRYFPMSQLFISVGQSIGASVSSSVLQMNIQGWFPLGLTGWISLQSKGLSRVFSNTTVQKHQFFDAQLSL